MIVRRSSQHLYPYSERGKMLRMRVAEVVQVGNAPDCFVRARVRVQKAYRMNAVCLNVVHHMTFRFSLDVVSGD